MPKKDQPDTVRLRKDGKTDNFFGPKNSPHGHTVVKPNGSLSYLRDRAGKVHFDDKRKKK